MLEINKVFELLKDNPNYIEILQRAVAVEERLREEAYLFDWDNIPGESETILRDYLYQQFYRDWIKESVISVPNKSTINVHNDEYSITIKLNEDMRSAIAEINDGTDRTCGFDVIQQWGQLGLYKSSRVMWEWHDVQAASASIRKMVIAGIIKVVYKTNKSTEYALVDRDVVAKALEEIEYDQDTADFEANQPEPDQTELEVPEDVFDIIVGYDDVKSIISKGLQSDQPVNVLFIGAPGTAKSMFLEELNRIPGSSYHLGSSSTKAGLSDFLFDVQPRIMLIDELEKMDRKDYAVLLSLMAGGKVVETKKNRRREIKLNTIVFAACNTIRNIPPENMSRFNFEFAFDQYTHAEFEDVVTRILVTREGVTPELAGYIAEKLSDITQDPRKSLGIARICDTTDDVDQAIETMLKYKV